MSLQDEQLKFTISILIDNNNSREEINKVERRIYQLINDLDLEGLSDHATIYKSEKTMKSINPLSDHEEAIIFTLEECLNTFNYSANTLWKLSLVFPELLTKIYHSKESLSLKEIRSKLIEHIKKCDDIEFDNPALTIRSLNIINTEYISLTLSELANQLKVNSSYLSRVISKNTSCSFVQILHTRRVLEAIKLIISTNLSINEISHTIGYNNIHYFYKVFKQMTTITPAKIRTYVDT